MSKQWGHDSRRHNESAVYTYLALQGDSVTTMIGVPKRPRPWGHSIKRNHFAQSSSSTTGRRRIDIPSPFPTTPTCPEPTCSCAETPPGLDIDRERSLSGSMAGYSQQVLIATGQPDWRSRIEEDGVDEGWGILGRGLKGLIGRGGKYSDVRILSVPTQELPLNHSSMLLILYPDGALSTI